MNRVKIPKTWNLTFPPQASNHLKHFPKLQLSQYLKKTLLRFPKTLRSLKPITLPIFRENRPVIKPFYQKILKRYKQEIFRYLNVDLGHISSLEKYPFRSLKTLRFSFSIKSQPTSRKTKMFLHKIISSNKHLKKVHLPPDIHYSKICFKALNNLKTLSDIFIPTFPSQNGLFQRVLSSNLNLKKIHFNSLMNSEQNSLDPQTSLKILETLTRSSRLQKLQFCLKYPSSLTLQDLPLQKLDQKNIHYDIRLYITPQDIMRSNPNLLNLDLFGLYVGSEENYCEGKKYFNQQFSLRKNADRKLYLIDLPQSFQNNPNPFGILRSCLNIHTLHLTLPRLPQTTDYTPIRQLANLAHLSLDLTTEILELLIEHFTYNFNTFRKIESILLKCSIINDIILLPLWTACTGSLKKLTLVFQHNNHLNTNLNGLYNGIGQLQNLESLSICLSDGIKEHKEPLRRVFDEHYSAINAFMNEGIPLKEFIFCAFPNSALSASTLKFNLNYNFSTLEKISLDIRNKKVDPREEIFLSQAINLKYLHLYLYEWNASKVQEFLKRNDRCENIEILILMFECSDERYEGAWHREGRVRLDFVIKQRPKMKLIVLTNKNGTCLSAFRRITLGEMEKILSDYFFEQRDITFDKFYL